MVYKKLKKLGQARNWHRTKQSIFGLHEGFCFNIIQSNLLSSPQFKNIHVRTKDLNRDQQRSLLDQLKENKSRKTYQEYRVGDDFILITMYEPFFGVKNERLIKMMNWLTDRLKSVDAEKLVEEDKVGDYGFYDVSGEGKVLEVAAVEELRETLTSEYLQEEAERSSYLKGFIGALLFSIPVIILWVLMAIYLQILSSGLGLIMAFAAYLGYEKFKGKRGGATKWILVLTLLIAIFLANALTIYFELHEYGMNMNNLISQLMTKGAIRDSFIENVGLSFILGLMAWLWIIFGIQTGKPYLNKAEKL